MFSKNILPNFVVMTAMCCALMGIGMAASFASVDLNHIDVPARISQYVDNNASNGEYSDAQKEILSLGYLDVTWDGYGATANIHSDDDREAFQNAIDDAYQHRLAVFVPPGTYEIGNSLGLYRWRNSAQDKNPNVLVGNPPDADNPLGTARPVIRLKPNAPGFGDSNDPRAMLEVQTFSRNSPNTPITPKPDNSPTAAPFAVPEGYGYSEQPGDTMYVDIRNVNFDTNNNPGAIGVYFPGAQNSTIVNVKITATGSYSGFAGIPGAGGGARNIEVDGGTHALYGSSGGSGAFIVGARFVNQTGQVVFYKQKTPLTMVGFEIIKDAGHGIETGGNGSQYWPPNQGVLTLIDGIISLENGQNYRAINNVLGKTIYLKNVYTAGHGSGVIKSGAEPEIYKGGGQWRHIREYSYTDQSFIDATPGDGDPGVTYNVGDEDFYSYSIVNGTVSQTPEHMYIENLFPYPWPDNKPPEDLIDKHLAPMPQRTWQQANTAENVIEHGAVGDGVIDDTQAIQSAIAAASDAEKIVYFPAGTYPISETLVLSEHVKFVGAGREVSKIVVHDDWQPSSGVATMIKTQTSTTADNFMGFLSVETRNKGGGLVPNGDGNNLAFNYDRFSAINWQSGANSSMMGVDISEKWHQNRPTHKRHVLHFSGHSGGKHYFLSPHNAVAHSNEHPDYRKLYMVNSKQPTDFYSLNVEHSKSNAEIQLVNTDNVNLYHLKREGQSKTMSLWNSKNIGLYGSGAMREGSDSAFVYVAGGSKNITLANIMVHIVSPYESVIFGNATVRENFDGNVTDVVWPNSVSYFYRGDD